MIKLTFPTGLALLASLVLAGCDSAPDTLREGLGFDVPAHSRTFPGGPKETYAAARAALAPMGFRFVKGGQAQGLLEAISDVSNGETMASVQQFRIKATFVGVPDGGGTRVDVRMTQIIQEDAEHQLGMATESPLTDTPLYEVFFHGIQQELSMPAKP